MTTSVNTLVFPETVVAYPEKESPEAMVARQIMKNFICLENDRIPLDYMMV